MKRLLPLVAMAVIGTSLAGSPALAQNQGQISKARSGGSCPGCNLFQANFSGASMTGRNYARARLRQSDLSLSTMNGANFSGADLRDVEAYGGVFSSASFAGADLTNASFVGAYLQGANFSGARLSGTNFSGAQLARARGLSQAQLNGACGDAATDLPAGLRIPACR
jgi:uncharacterized protein YjbI with pentapeptide repeats